MTAYRFVTLTCDGCGEIWDYGIHTRFASARQAARAMGWTQPTPTTDRCDNCTANDRRDKCHDQQP